MLKYLCSLPCLANSIVTGEPWFLLQVISSKPVPEEMLKPKDASAPETSSSGVLVSMQEIKTEDFAVPEQVLICP